MAPPASPPAGRKTARPKGKYAKHIDFYNKYPYPVKVGEAIISDGLGLSSTEFTSVKNRVTKLIDTLMPADQGSIQRSDVDTKFEIADRVVSQVPQLQSRKAPMQWFKLAVYDIARAARHRVKRRVTEPKKNKAIYKISDDDDDDDDDDNDDADNSDNGDNSVNGDNGDNSDNGDKSYSAQRSHRKPGRQTQKSKRGVKLQNKKRKRDNRASSIDRSDDEVPPPKLARRAWPLLVTHIEGEDASEVVEVNEILDDAGAPSFEKLTKTLFPFTSHLSDVKYLGSWRDITTVIRSDSMLLRVINWAQEQDEHMVTIRACAGTLPSRASYELGSSGATGAGSPVPTLQGSLAFRPSPNLSMSPDTRIGILSASNVHGLRRLETFPESQAVPSVEREVDVDMEGVERLQHTEEIKSNVQRRRDVSVDRSPMIVDDNSNKEFDHEESDDSPENETSSDLDYKPDGSPIDDSSEHTTSSYHNRTSGGPPEDDNDENLLDGQANHGLRGNDSDNAESHGDGAVSGQQDEYKGYQAGPIDQYCLDESQLQTLAASAELDGQLGLDTGNNEEFNIEEAMYKKVQDEINATLHGRLARQNTESIQGVARRFHIPESAFVSSNKRIQIDPRWMLGPNAALYPHQWQLVDEMMQQEALYGGGIVGDPPGVGKTHPMLFKSYANYFIMRLRLQLEKDKETLTAEPPRQSWTPRHIMTDPALQTDDETCPSQPNLPIPCPCKVGNWTHSHKIPRGVALYVTMAGILKTTTRALEHLFDGAPILDEPELPFRIAIAHAKTRESQPKDNPSTFFWQCRQDLDIQTLGLMCRRVQWGDGIAPSGSTYVTKPTFPPRLRCPSGATIKSCSDEASCILIVTTMQSLKPQLFNSTTVEASWKEKARRKGKSKGAGISSNDADDGFRRAFINALVTREITLDEGHNYYSFDNSTMSGLRALRLGLDTVSEGEFVRCWMLSGTARVAGLNITATFVSSMLYRKSWSTASDDTEDGFLTKDRKRWLSRLSYESQNGQKRVYQQLQRAWDSIVRAANHEENGSAVGISKDKMDVYNDYIHVSSQIYEALLIERAHDTKRLDNGPLIATSDIKTLSAIKSVSYPDVEVEYINRLVADVKTVVVTDLDAKRKAWEAKGCKGAEPTNTTDLKFVKGYLDLCIASTSPGLIRWYKEQPGGDPDDEKKGLTTRDIAPLWENLCKTPIYTEFDRIIAGDNKWTEVCSLVKKVIQTPKQSGANSKLLIGARCPAVALLYTCGMLRMMGQKKLTSGDLTGIENERVTAVHSGIKPERRMAHFDAFNNEDSQTQFLITTIELVAEGVSLVGANFVLVVDPHPKIEKTIQFCGRASRHGQTEPTVIVTQLYNADSPVDRQIMKKQQFSKNMNADISKIGKRTREAQDTSIAGVKDSFI